MPTNEREQWLENRKKGIGGSDAAAIIGCNPYKTNVDLWKEKTGQKEAEDISNKDCVQYGKAAEAPLRELFKLDYPEYSVEYDEFEMIHNPKHDFIFATLDGKLTEISTGRKGILEVKTTNILQSMQLEKWNDRIPENYYVQILHELLATEWEFVKLKAQLKSIWQKEIRLTTRHYHIERCDVKDDLDYLLHEEIKFWEHVKNKTMPPLVLPKI